MAVDKLVDSVRLDNDLIAVADAIRGKTGESESLAFPAEYVSEIGRMKSPSGTWIKPVDWPDLDSIELPTDDAQNDVYFLYDRSCGFDKVYIQCAYYPDVYKGTIINGQFVGEKVGSRVHSVFEDTLTERFTVYRVTGENGFLNVAGYNSDDDYSLDLQSMVWVRGVIPFVKSCGKILTVHTQAVELTHINQQTISNGLADSPMTPALKRYVLGYRENGDFNGATVERGGNGPLFVQPLNDDRLVTIKNAIVNYSRTGIFGQMRNVAFENCTLVLANSFAQDSPVLTSFAIKNSTATCTNANYLFSGSKLLEVCDLSEVDFSGATSAVNPFGNCRNLRILKLNSTWAFDLDLRSDRNITRETVLGLFNDLPTVSETRYLRLPAGIKNYLISAEEIEVITEKGWTVA